MIDHADALDWLDTAPDGFILTDPPHVDAYNHWTDHYTFTEKWLPKAFRVGTVVTSCGPNPQELHNYLDVGTPDQILIWPHQPWGKPANGFEEAHFYQLVYGEAIATTGYTTVIATGKPDPFYHLIIEAFTNPGDMVIDPFAGCGEVPLAARQTGRRWAGCELDLHRVKVAWEQGL